MLNPTDGDFANIKSHQNQNSIYHPHLDVLYPKYYRIMYYTHKIPIETSYINKMNPQFVAHNFPNSILTQPIIVAVSISSSNQKRYRPIEEATWNFTQKIIRTNSVHLGNRQITSKDQNEKIEFKQN
jgi:hypothetical protein